jgi:hypothetical protein
MSRKVYVTITAKAILVIPEGVNVGEFLEEAHLLLEHPLVFNTIDIEQLDIESHEITDSK